MPTVEYEVVDRIAYITFNRPEKHNALTDEMVLLAARYLRQVDSDDAVDLAIVSGNGRSYCSGADLKERLMASAEEGDEGMARPSENDSIFKVNNYKPIIGAVHGYCLGHALGVALAFDLIVAAEDTKFQVTETAFGIPMGGIWSALRFASGSATFATDVVFSGRMFSGEEAYRMGVVTRSVPSGTQLDAARELSATLLAYPQAGLRELVRLRRSALAEVQQHSSGIQGVFRWNDDPAFGAAVSKKMGTLGRS